MAVRRLDAAVLVADARIVAGRLKAVVVAERPVTGRRIVILTIYYAALVGAPGALMMVAMHVVHWTDPLMGVKLP